MASDPFAPSWISEALARELALRESPRSKFMLPRLHYSSDLEPEACARRTFYALRYEGVALDNAANLTSWLGDELEAKAVAAIERSGRLVAKQVKVKPLRPSAWCWEGTLDLLVREPEPDQRLVVIEVKSVEPEIARLLQETGRLDLAKRERHLWQLAAYRHAVAERFGQNVGHKLLFLARGDAPTVEMSPPLPTVEQIVSREIEVSRLLPSAEERSQLTLYGAKAVVPPAPPRLPLVQRPRKKTWEASPVCRWCSYRDRCEVEQEVVNANVTAADGLPLGPGWQKKMATVPPVSQTPGPTVATKVPGAWDFAEEGAPQVAPVTNPVILEECEAVHPGVSHQLDEDRKLVERIDKFGKNLSENEVDFVISFMERLAGGEPLSEKQRAVAMRIDEARVS